MLRADWDKITKVYIIYHTDMDGEFSAYIAKKYANEEKDIAEVRYIPANYSFDLPKYLLYDDLSDAMIIIVDFSPTVEFMFRLLHNKTIKEQHIIWIDHHITAIDKFNRLFPRGYNLPGLRSSDELCGAELTYLYLYEGIENLSRDPFKPDYLKDSKPVTRKEIVDLIDVSSMNELKIVGDYDTFRVNTNTMHAFQLYYRVNKPKFEPIRACDEFFEGMLNVDNLTNILADGDIMKQYVDANNAQLIHRIGYKGVLRKFEDVEAICVNACMNSTIFDSVKDDYEVGIVYYYNGRNQRMMYIIFRLGKNPDRFISCAKMAESYGGGGHERAAGFSTSGTLEIKPVK